MDPDPFFKPGLHARNRFRAGYDFARLVARHRPLARFVAPNPRGEASIDYADPDAVKALNQALLKLAYGLEAWDIPKGHLCPPIPGRSDYLHHVADLLASDASGVLPRGPAVRVLDIGVGANCIYPLIGASEYGWSFVGSEVNPHALHWARKLVQSNPSLHGLIDVRPQSSAAECFAGVVGPGESFDLSMCNPPFHASAAEAAAGTRRKLRNLGGTAPRGVVRNFGGSADELWCPGGELGFVRRMIAQSAEVAATCLWFTTLVSKSAHLAALERALAQAGAVDVRTIAMAQGQKRSRILAWTFLSPPKRRAWARRRGAADPATGRGA